MWSHLEAAVCGAAQVVVNLRLHESGVVVGLVDARVVLGRDGGLARLLRGDDEFFARSLLLLARRREKKKISHVKVILICRAVDRRVRRDVHVRQRIINICSSLFMRGVGICARGNSRSTRARR